MRKCNYGFILKYIPPVIAVGVDCMVAMLRWKLKNEVKWPVFVVLLFSATCLLLPASASAQFSNLRTRLIDTRIPEQTLDSLTLYPLAESVLDSASGQNLPLSFFHFKNTLLLIDTAGLHQFCGSCNKVFITYRTLAIDLARPVFRLDTTLIKRAGIDNDIAFDYAPYAAVSSNPFATPGLNSSGAYTRGLSFGNSQNLVFNSNLNLQLEGRLGNDLTIRAALSDNSVPLQPDGTTQRLQEFDRIFIELEQKNKVLSAGDLDMIKPDGYFSNYFKRIQGAKFALAPMPKQPGGWISAGISKGKFNRQIIPGQEGNQGPYRLQGAEGERFIIVLAGTEKVYVDGQLLQRGQADDYVVDYNLGEVTFTPKRLITKDIRIIIEFEYAVQNYLRSTMAARLEMPLKKGKVWINAYSEQDGLNATGNQDLSADERFRLAQAGDNLRDAYASGIDTLESFDASRVLYRSMDTVFCGGTAAVLVYSTDQNAALFAVRFSEVPVGQGNYVQVTGNTNGRVYRWVAPDPVSCTPTGNFEPIVRLIAPEQKQLHTAGVDIQIAKNTTVYAEAALSQRDFNRFSPIGNDDNLGGGGVLKIKQRLKPRKNWSAALDANAEIISANFAPLNPYRSAEFTRDWNTGQFTTAAAEQIIKSGFTLERNQWGIGNYEFGRYSRAGQYTGQKHLAKIKLQRAGWDLAGEINTLATEGNKEITRFSRPKLDIARSFMWKQKTPVLRLGVYGERERNSRRDLSTDTLNRTGFWYDLGRIYAQMPGTKRAFQAGGYISQRNDYFPLANGFEQSTAANDINVNGKWDYGARPLLKKTSPGGFEWNFTYRNLRVVNSQLTTQTPQSTYLGRLDYHHAALKNGITFSTGYEVGSGQTPKVEFNYLYVNPGEGLYSWFDRNRDSIIQVDEMEIAVFQDQASYVRVAVATQEYLRTNNTTFNQNLRIEPRLWLLKPKKNWQKIVRKLAAQSTLQINRRVLAGVPGISPWNAFELDIADTALVTINSTVRHILYVNRADPDWDVSLSYGDNRSRLLITSGFESRRLSDQILHTRLNLTRRWSFETDITNSLKINETENFVSRNYQIPGLEFTPKLTWNPAPNFRLITRFSYKTKTNTLESAEKATQKDWNGELTWNPSSKAKKGVSFSAATSLRAKMTLADIQYSGQPNTPVAFAMLEGLQDGRNWLWSLILDRQLSKTMQLNLSYEGRRTGTGARLVHVARAQVRAVF